MDTDTHPPRISSLNGPTSQLLFFYTCSSLSLENSHPLSPNAPNGHLPKRYQLSERCGHTDRALDAESIVLVLSHQPAAHSLDAKCRYQAPFSFLS